jgi:glycosyltransferase involved in cell wall biosynthesis
MSVKFTNIATKDSIKGDLPSILINASNLHVGGGVQVASSFIHELSLIEEGKFIFHLEISSEVAKNIATLNTDFARFKSNKIHDSYGLKDIKQLFIRDFSNYAAVFTIFGPHYSLRIKCKSIIGFAQPWIINSDKRVYNTIPPHRRFLVATKYYLQSLFFKTANQLIVELDHVKRGLIKKLSINPEKIHVINNCINSIYHHQDLWKKIDFSPARTGISLGLISRDYPHKNINMLPSIKSLLLQKYNLSINFYVTLTESEWSAKTEEFKASCTNVGQLSIAQCPDFYSKLDGVIFPSLLECFSATPLEAMFMGCPLFASNLPFARDIAGPHASYFDPYDPHDAARSIAHYFNLPSENRLTQIELAKARVKEFPTAQDRAKSYVNIISSTLK